MANRRYLHSLFKLRESAPIARLFRPPAMHALRHVSAHLSHLHGDEDGAQ